MLSLRNDRVIKGEREIITLAQEWPRNSFTDAASWAYIKGEIQKPQIHQLGILSVTRWEEKKRLQLKRTQISIKIKKRSKFTSWNHISTKSHNNQHCKRSKCVSHNHITPQGSHQTEKTNGHLVKEEKKQKLL